MTITREHAAQARAAATAAPADRPSQRRAGEDPVAFSVVRGVLDVQEVREETRNGMTVVRVGGMASTTEQPYEMWDAFGPYSEVVSRDAFGKTLAANPQVEFTVNHGAGGGLPMAHTRNGTLDLVQDEHGLRYDAYVDPQRADVQDMLRALSRRDLAESSFKFRITRGIWSPDYTEYRIDETDLHRGDVSAVNFGANPNTTSGLRAQPTPAAPVPAAALEAPAVAPAPRRDQDVARARLALALDRTR